MAASEVFANQAFTTVQSGGTSAGTVGTIETWTVSQATGSEFPTASTGVSQFHVTDTAAAAASEIILVTATNAITNQWTVTRGAEGTSPVAHTTGFTITQVLTAGWLTGVISGVNAVGNGGTGGTSATAYALLAGGTTATAPFQQVSGLGTSGYVLTSQGAGALPQWTANSGGSISVPVPVNEGGTGGTSATSYAVITGGTASTTPFQQVASLGTSGQVLTSKGAGSLPTWTTPPGTGLTVVTPSGDTSGTTDSLAVQALLAAGGVSVTLAPGTFYFASPVNLLHSSQSVRGSGVWSTSVLITTGFAGSAPSGSFLGPAAFQIWRQGGFQQGCQISDMFIGVGGGSLTGYPAANAVNIYGVVENVISNLHVGMNGYGIESIASSSSANYGTIIRGLQANAGAAGVHIKSISAQSWGAQHFLTDINLQSVGVATGPAANLDCLFFEDCWDVLSENVNAAISDASTGSTLHIKGKIATCYGTNLDLGCYPNGSGTNSVILIEDSSNGSPEDVHLVNGVAQQGFTGMTITGGAYQSRFVNCRFYNNYADGTDITGTGTDLRFTGCTFRQNGQAAAGTIYDLGWSGTATGSVAGCDFASPIVGGGTIGVHYSVKMASAGQAVPFSDAYFTATGETTANNFTNLPVYVSQQDIAPSLVRGSETITGNLTVSGTLTATPPLAVTSGGTGGSAITAYAVVTGGTSSTTALQQVSGLGTSKQLLTSNGAGALPTWQNVSGQFLNTYRYGSTVQTGFGINSTTPAAFGSGTIATQAFTAPPSGSVLITVNCMLVTSASGVYVALYLSPSGSVTTISSDVLQYESPSAGFSPQQAFPFLLTGLSSGTSYNYDLIGSCTSGQSGTIVAYTQASYPPTLGTNAVRGAPVIITVQAV